MPSLPDPMESVSLFVGCVQTIEALFSDFKTRGFGLEDSHIERTDRLDRLVLVLSLALHWAVSTGMWDAVENRTPAEKRRRGRRAETLHAA